MRGGARQDPHAKMVFGEAVRTKGGWFRIEVQVVGVRDGMGR